MITSSLRIDVIILGKIFYFLSKMSPADNFVPKIMKLRQHLLKLFRENYWLHFSGHGVHSPKYTQLLKTGEYEATVYLATIIWSVRNFDHNRKNTSVVETGYSTLTTP